MNALVTDAELRERQLRALGVEPWRLRRSEASTVTTGALAAEAAPIDAKAVPRAKICRLALHPDQAELRDPAIHRMYAALTEAVCKAGLQAVRVCDVVDDPTAAVMVFGTAPLPEGVPAVRILRADPLAVLYADRERKRLLWEQMLALGRVEGG
ncbi:MAG: hypothetical protein ACREPU_00070 [Rhodanobacteraceae bacterium]